MSISEAAHSPGFQKYIAEMLLEICAIDTTPRADLVGLRAAEQAIFDVLERQVHGLPGLRVANAALALTRSRRASSQQRTISPARPGKR